MDSTNSLGFSRKEPEREPWYCQGCKCFFYNTIFLPATSKEGSKVYPVPGAPIPKYLMEFGNVCWVCFAMYQAVAASEYHRKLHEAYVNDEFKRSQRNKKLRSDGDYFGSNA